MKHLWSLICQQAVINQQTNNVSLIEVLERVLFQVEGNPTDAAIEILPLQIVLVTLWERSEPDEPERFPTRVVIRGPEGKVLKLDKPQTFDINLEHNQRNRMTIHFHAVPFRGSGTYTFEVQAQHKDKWRLIASVPLEIIRQFSDDTTP